MPEDIKNEIKSLIALEIKNKHAIISIENSYVKIRLFYVNNCNKIIRIYAFTLQMNLFC